MIRQNETFFAELWLNTKDLPPDVKRKYEKRAPKLKKFSHTAPEVRDTAELFETQWSPEFEQLMRNRLALAVFRYGKFQKNRKEKWDHTSSVESRLDQYRETGNAEHLIDIANLMMCEFIDRNHPDFHMEAIDDGVHSESLK